MITLAIESSTQYFSVALLEEVSLLKQIEVYTHTYNEDSMMGCVVEVFESCALGSRDIDLIAVDCGPGRFTPLRIGVATARAFGQLNAVPLVRVDSLSVLQANVRLRTLEDTLVVAIIHSRKETAFVKLSYKNTHSALKELRYSELIDTLKEYQCPMLLIGCTEWADSLQANFQAQLLKLEDAHPHAYWVGVLGYEYFLDGKQSHYSQVTPLYLHNFSKTAHL